jgi:small conductance mechanosensitive channel
MSHRLDVAISIAITLGIAVILSVVIRVVVDRVEHHITAKMESDGSGEKRAHTMAGIVRAVVIIVVWVIAVVTAMQMAGVPVAPLLATAGIGGIAIGFGAQTLIRDLLAGVFLLLENQYDVGDSIQIAGVSGVVEAVGLRTTTLRAADGVRHVVSNGEIRISSNQTRVFSRSVVMMPISYDSDLDRAVAVIRHRVTQLRLDPTWGADIQAEAEVVGIDAFGPNRIEMTVSVQTRPGRQWAIARELRRQLKSDFDAAGIAMNPSPPANPS